jgi:hypothetical protein
MDPTTARPHRFAGRLLVAIATVFANGCATERPASAPPPTFVAAAPEETVPPAREPPPPAASAPDPTPAPPLPAAPAPPTRVQLAHGIEVDREARRVTVPARVATTQGFLEQVVCGTDSREHESLLVLSVKASEVHAALLLAGAAPGKPGRWRYDGAAVVTELPSGSPLRVRVRYRERNEPDAAWIERDIAEWIRGVSGAVFSGGWVFAGSQFAPNPRSWKRPGEHYVADYSGSIVGLVTFGDETVAATKVIPDQIDIEAATWEAWTSRMPAPDAEAILVLELAEPPTTSVEHHRR